MKKKPQQVTSLLRNSSANMAKLFAGTEQLQRLQQQLNNALEDEVRGHCRVLSYRHGVIELELDSPVWQWRVNMGRSRLIEKLRQQGLHQLATIQSKVSPQVTITRDNKSSVSSGFFVDRKISSQTAEELLCLAARVPEPLKSKLVKLAEHKNDKAS